MKKVIVIGAGLGGLATAIQLARKGFNVTVLEKNDQIGGRARVYKKNGFSFDMGPSWYMMPDVFDAFFKWVGAAPDTYYKLKKLDTHYKIFLQNGNEYTVFSDLQKNVELFEKTEQGAGENLLKYLASAKFLYDFVIGDLIYYDHTSLRPLMQKRLVQNAHKLKLLHSFDAEIKRFFRNEDLQKVLEFTTVFLGGSPYNTPAFYTLISHTDFNLKIWHPIGGIHKIVEAMKVLCKENGVRIKAKEAVKKIDVVKGVAHRVITEKSEYDADIVICNADYHHCETQLLDPKWQTYPESYWKKKTLSPTAFVIYLGLNKKVRNMEHHNFYFDDSWTTHFKDVFKSPKWPKTPSYYVHVPTITDPSLAPKNHDILYFLVPVAPGLKDSTKTREYFAKKVIKHYEKITGESISEHILIKRIFSHRDFIHDYNSYKGTAFGLAHTLTQTAFMRPKNKSKKVNNMYYAGQYTNPGIGMPLCLISSRIVTNLIEKEQGI